MVKATKEKEKAIKKQYGIRNYSFKNLKEDKKGNLFFNSDDAQKNIEELYFYNSENIFYELINRLVGREYIEVKINKEGKKVNENNIPEIFVLKSRSVTEDKEKLEENINKYEKATKEGIYIDGKKYLLSQMSSSMVRTQKSIYIQEELKDTVEEYLTLGTLKNLDHCVVSKIITTQLVGILIENAPTRVC